MKYAVIIEKSTRNYGAYVPDLPGCVATGKNSAEVRRRIERAISNHIRSLREHGETVPKPTTRAVYADVPASA
jgi:predicted RNase H-like HicB family nuclease